jgi:hypothetical protein
MKGFSDESAVAQFFIDEFFNRNGRLMVPHGPCQGRDADHKNGGPRYLLPGAEYG